MTVYGSGSAAIKVKAGSTAKRVVLVDVSPAKVVGLTPRVDRPWRSVSLKVGKQPHGEKHPAKE